METLLKVMRRLRAPGGCPWDQQQTHESLRPYLLEEAAETVDAISAGDAAELCGELGDVLLQVAFHAVIAEEAGDFSYADIEAAIVEKLERRHPHVFADVQVKDADEVVSNWQAIKAQERGEKLPSAALRVPRSLSTLMRAAELSKALDWPLAAPETLQGALRALAQQQQAKTPELPAAESAWGEVLLMVAQHALAAGVNPELALRRVLDERAEGASAP